ncbi:alpha/beta hydrolase [Leptospira sp. GIMC2001]|nr:alpha/beta hydrolase [Leptospira sp. GIMC2001]WCL51418.1 alpha/beta hydrolase [Leptospira sp. GIMC2001]
MVSLIYFDDAPSFSYSIFEIIDKDAMKVVATATHFKLKELAMNKKVAGIDEYTSRAKPIPLSDPRNESAIYLKEAIIDFNKGLRPEIKFLDLKKEPIHPDKKILLSDTMNYAVGLPLFIKDNPIGILWGIAKDPIEDHEKEELRQQFYSLFDVIEFVIGKELDGALDTYMARKNIEKADTHSSSKNLFYTTTEEQKEPVTSIIFRSYQYETEYRMDASFIIPTSKGYAVSLKQFTPEKLNNTNKNILMIPGFFCRRSVMDKLAKEMALKYGYRVFSMDMRGRSKQTMPRNGRKEGWTVDDYIQSDFPEVLRWLRQQYPNEKTVVLGHSMGGMIPRFYASAYNKICEAREDLNLPDPKKYISGIISITSPNYISINSNILYIDQIKKGLNMIPSKSIVDFFLNMTSFSMQTTIQTIDLKKFFKMLLNMHESLRPFSFDIGTKMLTIKDFVGYKEITPPEWYFLVEDVFCEESVSVIMQFVHSQLSNDKCFLSSDGRINYTKEQENFDLPIYSILGTVDKIVPMESIEEDLANLPSKNKVIEKYEQGHLGIVFHNETVRQICQGLDAWIQDLG